MAINCACWLATFLIVALMMAANVALSPYYLYRWAVGNPVDPEPHKRAATPMTDPNLIP